MQFKHSLSIFSTNLSLSYKVLLLFFIVFIIASALFVSLFTPIIKGINEALTLEGITLSAKEILNNPIEQLTMIRDTASNYFSNHQAFLASRFFFMILVFVFARFFVTLALVPVTKFIYDKMTTGYSSGLFQNMIAALPQTLLFALLSSIIYSILDIGIFFLSIYIFIFLFNLINVSALLPAFACFILLYTVRSTLFSSWLPLICDSKKNIFALFIDNFKLSLKSFSIHFPMALTMTIIYATIITTSTLSTFAVLPIATFPMFTVLMCIFNLVCYFKLMDRKYYIDDGITVFDPKINSVK